MKTLVLCVLKQCYQVLKQHTNSFSWVAHHRSNYEHSCEGHLKAFQKTNKTCLIISNSSSIHSTLISWKNDFRKTLPCMLEFSSCLVQVLGLVSQIQSIFFMHVGDSPYMKGPKFSTYLDCWELTRTFKVL